MGKMSPQIAGAIRSAGNGLQAAQAELERATSKAQVFAIWAWLNGATRDDIAREMKVARTTLDDWLTEWTVR